MRRAPGRTGGWVGACLLGIMVLAGAAWGASAYIQPGDWQYQALDSLAQAGLLAGHPKAPLSTWTDRLSRYEAAALTLRAVEGIGQAYQAQGAKLRELAQANEPVPATPAEPGAAPATPAEPAAPAAPVEGPALRTEDLLATQKLLEEFRTELVGMGERLDELETSLKLVLGMVEEVQKQVAAVAADQKKHKLGGYTQLRWSRDEATQGKENFYVKSARFDMRGPLGPKTAYRLEAQLDGSLSPGGPGSKAQLRTVSIDYKLSDATFSRTGQVTLPFGYELEEFTPSLWTGDRSLVMDTLFPNQRDLGTYVENRQSAAAPKYDLGVFNGTGINALDNNTQVNGLGRVMANVSYGSAAVSAYGGTNGANTSRTTQNRYGAGTKLAFGQTLFMGEYVAGQNLGFPVEGWYAQLGHPLLKNRSDLIFAKYDTYDEDTDAPGHLFKRWSLGYYYNLDNWTRLTLVTELRSVSENFSQFQMWNGNAAFLQLQAVF